MNLEIHKKTFKFNKEQADTMVKVFDKLDTGSYWSVKSSQQKDFKRLFHYHQKNTLYRISYKTVVPVVKHLYQMTSIETHFVVYVQSMDGNPLGKFGVGRFLETFRPSKASSAKLLFGK